MRNVVDKRITGHASLHMWQDYPYLAMYHCLPAFQPDVECTSMRHGKLVVDWADGHILSLSSSPAVIHTMYYAASTAADRLHALCNAVVAVMLVLIVMFTAGVV